MIKFLNHNWSGWPGAYCLNCGLDFPEDLDDLYTLDIENDDEIPKGCPGPKDAHNPYVKRSDEK